jgi:hypothetical protein
MRCSAMKSTDSKVGCLDAEFIKTPFIGRSKIESYCAAHCCVAAHDFVLHMFNKKPPAARPALFTNPPKKAANWVTDSAPAAAPRAAPQPPRSAQPPQTPPFALRQRAAQPHHMPPPQPTTDSPRSASAKS